ncbi:MAG: hypothetical protein D9V45_02635 [Chloroflexi bacterium]|nr:MAG: hypothetical protein D9V45_02635 [Chloroflexota bacterium]
METYVAWVTANPLFSAAVQFSILGTLGEIISFSLQKKRFALPVNGVQLVGKIFAWALLGIVIKYGFTGMKGFTQALLDHHLLPQFVGSGVGRALAVSLFTNILFGPQMMTFHRLEDNLILRQKGFSGITRAWWTLIWFWIPAHTLTFSLPTDYQIGLAALWSLVLGIIMGYSKAHVDRKTQPAVVVSID